MYECDYLSSDVLLRVSLSSLRLRIRAGDTDQHSSGGGRHLYLDSSTP